MRTYKIMLAGICLLILQLNISAQKQPFSLEDYRQIVSISDPQISPDGEHVLMVCSRPDYQKNMFRTELCKVQTGSGKIEVLVNGKWSISHPRWSPDGSLIAFMAKEKNEKSALLQIFIGVPGQDSFWKASSALKGVQHFSWSPDSKQIAFVTADESADKERREKGFTDFEVGDNDMFIESKPASAHIWLLDIQTKQSKRLTSGNWSLPVTIPPGAPSSPLSWSPDGKTILFVQVPSPFSGDMTKNKICQLDLASGSIHPLTGRERFESYPNFSPDGKQISYWHRKNQDLEEIYEVRLRDDEHGIDASVSSMLDRDLYRTIWMPDGKSLIVGGHDDNKTSLWQLKLDGSVSKMDLAAVCPFWSFWMELSVAKNGALAFVGTTPDHPAELYLLKNPNGKPVQLTKLNDWCKERTMGKTTTIRWNADEWSHSGILTYPADFKEDQKYPVVLIIHGGPMAASVEQFSRLTQVFANKGYFVFEPNYRGSDNQGSAYKVAITGDAAPGPGRDIMAGLAVVKKMKGVDSSRIGVTGWSYGGFMTVWLTGHYPGWKAAMAGAAVTDLVDQYNLCDFSINRGSAMGGSPWVGDNMKKYIEQSPITAASNIKAPMLILANTGDPRVPIGQSYKLYHALKDNGRETKFIAWPVKAHNASDPVTQMERDRYWTEWMDRYLKY